MGLFGKAQARRENNRRAENREWEARAEDRRATQNMRWAKSEMRDGRPGHARIWAEQGQAHVQEADRLRREADRLRGR